MSVKTKTNLLLDIAIFSVFLVAANPHLTGNTVHEWLSMSFGAAIITHLLFHWDWIVNVGKTFFKNLFNQSRLNFVVDAFFFIAMTATMLSGLLISKSILSTFGIQLDVSRSWKIIHSFAADSSMLLLGLHFALHWKWIVSNVNRCIVEPVRGIFQIPAPKTQNVTTFQFKQEK